MTIKPHHKVISALSIIVVLAGLLLGQLFQMLFLTLRITDSAMSPGLQPNDWIIARRGALPENMQHANRIIAYNHPLHPGKIDVKRIIAGSGDTLRYDSTKFFINGKRSTPLIPFQALRDTGIFFVDPKSDPFEYVLPKPGDTLKLDSLDFREFHFISQLIKQDAPDSSWSVRTTLYIDKEAVTKAEFKKRTNLPEDIYTQLSSLPWFHQENLLRQLRERFQKSELQLKNRLYCGSSPILSYVVKHPSYFVIGDKLSESNDSRFFGLVHSKAIIGRPFLIYWSKSTGTSSAIRFDRLFQSVS